VSRVGSLEFAPTHDNATPDDPHGHTLDLLRQHAWTWVSADYECISDSLEAWGSGSGSPPASAWPGGAQCPPTTHRVKAVRKPAECPDAVKTLVARHFGLDASSDLVVNATTGTAPDGGPTSMNASFTFPDKQHVEVFVSRRDNVYMRTPRQGADLARDLVAQCIAPARADPFDDWFAVGSALHGVSDGDQAMFDVWDAFSMLSPKYPGGKELNNRWKHFRGAHGVGTLLHMARTDNAAATEAVLRKHPYVFIGAIQTAASSSEERAAAAPADEPQQARSASLPTSLKSYAKGIAKHRPAWRLEPFLRFNTSRHTFTAMFAVLESDLFVHADGSVRRAAFQPRVRFFHPTTQRRLWQNCSS
jgi:hypothetical protein